MRSFVFGDDDTNSCVVCGGTESLGVQYGGKGGFITDKGRYIHATCLYNNISLLICKGKLIENISFDPLSNAWYFYNYDGEYGSYEHVDPELEYCPLCSDPLSDHQTILEKDKLNFEDKEENEKDNRVYDREWERDDPIIEEKRNSKTGTFTC